MTPDIKAIFLDVGNTLRIVVPDEPFMVEAKRQLALLTGTPLSPDEFFALLEERYKVLRKRAKEQLIEASEKEMWTNGCCPISPPKRLPRSPQNSPACGAIATAGGCPAPAVRR